MLLKRFASMTVCALMLLALAPPRAQSQSQPTAAAVERRRLTVPHAEAKPTLKALFAESASRAGAGGLTEADFKRFRKLRQQEETQPPPAEKMSKGMKVVIVIAIIASTALVVWAIANSVENPPSFCDTAPFDPDCIPN